MSAEPWRRSGTLVDIDEDRNCENLMVLDGITTMSDG